MIRRADPLPVPGRWQHLVVALLVALTGINAGAPPALAEPAGGLVTITFDDGNRSQHDIGLRIARKHGLPGTLFIPTGLVRDQTDTLPGSWLMTWADVRDFHAAGWEIGAHGHTHVRLPDLSADKVTDELTLPIQQLALQIGTRPVSFSSPFGAFSDESLDRIMAQYDYHLSWKGNGGRNPIEGLDPRYIGRFEVTSDLSATYMCGEMVRAAQNNVWLVLLFHGVVDGTPAIYEISAAHYDEILACAAFLDQSGVIEVLTVRDAMRAIAAR